MPSPSLLANPADAFRLFNLGRQRGRRRGCRSGRAADAIPLAVADLGRFSGRLPRWPLAAAAFEGHPMKRALAFALALAAYPKRWSRTPIRWR